MILLTLRYLTLLQLEKAQKEIYENATILSNKTVLYLLGECGVMLLQPYPFLKGTTFTTHNAAEDYPLSYPLNDFMAILSLTRVYILARSVLALTPYLGTRGTAG